MNVTLTSDATFQSVSMDIMGDGERQGRAGASSTKVHYVLFGNIIRIEQADGRVFDFWSLLPEGQAFFEGQFLVGKDDEEITGQLLIAPLASNGVTLSYMRFGSLGNSAPGTPETVRSSAFYFGVETKDMPTNGSAKYTVSASGNGSSEGVDYQLVDSSATFSANFRNGTISTLLHLAGPPVGGGESKDFGSFAGSGTIAQTTFSGTFADTDSGSFWGSFFGPKAAEVGYQYLIEAGPLEAYGGAVGFKK